MKRRVIQMMLAGIVSTLVLVASAASINAGEADPATNEVLRKLLTAVEEANYDSFVADGNAAFKAGLTKQMLEGVSGLLSSRMKTGYQTVYLGHLTQQGCHVHLWKLVFKDGGDDTLAKLVLKDGKIAGFWLQ